MMEVKTNKTVKNENEQGFEKTKLSEKIKPKNKSEKNVSHNEKYILKNKSKSKGEKTSKSSGAVLKRKVTEDGVSMERVLSAGEVSSGFETVSSIDSQVDIEDLDLISSPDEDNFIVTVKVENELAFQNRKEKNERLCYWENKSKSPIRCNHQNDYSSSEYGSRRQDGYRNFIKHQHRPKNNEDLSYKYNKKDRESSDRKDSISKKCSTHDHIRSKNSILSRSSRVSRRDTHNSRSRPSRSNERIIRSRVSKSPERNIILKSPSYKGRKVETNRSRSLERNSAKLHSKRDSPPRKRKKSPLEKSPRSSVWKQLDSRKSPNRLKKDSHKKTIKTYSSRRKERTPFLVELERKLQEAERLKNSIKEFSVEKDKTTVLTNMNSAVPKSDVQSAVNQNQSTSYLSTCISTQESIYSVQCTPMPAFSMENLPLVPGSTGLPVHITMSGEQILHDMDGRRIPVASNGFYLPLDPTGRLFAHIVSPGNLAVPIHMTEDGVLRLPNSEPVPYGPGHNLPVNIDGKVILIGPDSKPLYPCPNLPKEPPFNLLHMVQYFESAQQTVQMVSQPTQQTTFMVSQMENQKSCQIVPQTTESSNSQSDHSKAETSQNINQINSQSPKTNFNLWDFIPNTSEKINKADILKKYEKKAREKNEDVLRCIEIEKNLGVNPSKGGVKRSIPMKFSLKKTFKNSNFSSESDMNLDSNDLDSACAARSDLKLPKGSCVEIVLSSDDEQDVLKIDCDNDSSKPKMDQSDDPIIWEIQQALKSLTEKNYKPPVFGRFIISDLMIDFVPERSPNDSPLLRNRIKLPFLTPNSNFADINNKPVREEKTAVKFKFLIPKKANEKVEKRGDIEYNKTYNAKKLPVFTFDFSMQCDFTSITIKKLKSKVSELETEVVRLKSVNADFLESYRNVQEIIEKKDNELRTALLEIQEKHDEIESLKRSLEIRK